MVEFEEDEGSHRHPKRSKHTNHTQFPSTSIQDSIINSLLFLPPELVTEILLRLPVKTLVKFKSVSKSWIALIPSTEFVNMHLSISADNKDFTHYRLMLMFDGVENNLKECSVSSFLYDSVVEAFDLEYPMKTPSRSVKIVCSVNGLICLAISKRYLFIWNPSIRKFKKLPDCGDTSRARYGFMYGFGYDELRGDYKVVAGFRSSKSYYCLYIVKVKIYSMTSDSWTSIGNLHSWGLDNKSGMFVNGKLHWANGTYTCSHSHWDIVSVDLDDSKLGEVEQPYYGELGNFNCTLGVLGSDLSVLYNHRRSHVDVWVMKEYGVKESWIKVFTINIPCDHLGYQFCPFFCKRGILFQFGSTFMRYNQKDHSITHLAVTNTIFDYEANTYIESLVWPCLMEGTKDATMEKER